MTFTNSISGFDGAQELLIKLVEQSPDDWETRKRVVQVLYDEGLYREASKLVWAAPEVPPVTEEVVFTARVVAMGQPERAVRLVSTMIETNQDNPQECLNIAKALLKEGLSLQALRFYGVATAKDIELIDKDFEMALVNADSGDDHWEDCVEADDFPWEGPRDISLSDLADDGADGGASNAEILLNSVTQRVPLKAPVQQTASIGESAKDSSSLPDKPIREPKPMLSPAAEALVKQQAEGDTSSLHDQANEDGSFSSLVNFFKHKEMQQGQELDASHPEPVKSQAQPIKSQPLATAATSVDVSLHTSVDTRAEVPAAPSSPLVEGFQSRPSEPLTAQVPEVVVAPAEPSVVEQKAPEPVQEKVQVQEPQVQIPSEPVSVPVSTIKAPEPMVEAAATEPTVEQVPEQHFQAHANATPTQTAAIATPTAVEATATLAEVEPASRPEKNAGLHEAEVNQVIEQAAKSDDSPVREDEPENTDEPEEDVSDMVANVLAERQTAQPEAKKAGLFASLMAIFKRPKPAEQKTVSTASSAEVPAPQAVSEKVSEPEPAKAAEVAATAVQPVSSPVATTVLRKPETEAHEPPRELDGRTQLVALAPQDGSVFFDQLAAKYSNLAGGQLPPAATVARDMANVDYLQLINEACSKDLNAFSKLLGLHRVMTESNCTAWVEDMDLLRKGYGDAVLATVVSKYSVAECREILGAVYQRPGAQAAAS